MHRFQDIMYLIGAACFMVGALSAFFGDGDKMNNLQLAIIILFVLLVGMVIAMLFVMREPG
jgi:threonine/homoserine/homoserine lactone efflux protein